MSIIHIRCGSDIRQKLIDAGIEGDYLGFTDPVCQGPVPGKLRPVALRHARARYMADEWDVGGYKEILGRLDKENLSLNGLEVYDRIILWFEQNLYDQCILMRLLAEFEDRPAMHDKLFYINVEQHQAIAGFDGLSQMRPLELAALIDTEEPVFPAVRVQAREAWRAFISAHPRELTILVEVGLSPVPFLQSALNRFLQEYPWTEDGLSLTQQLTLRAFKAGVDTPAQALEMLTQKLDPQPYLSEGRYWPIIRSLTDAATPALTGSGSPNKPSVLTDFGEVLLSGEADWIAVNGIDRWQGGVHLHGSKAAWRWDDVLQNIVPGV